MGKTNVLYKDIFNKCQGIQMLAIGDFNSFWGFLGQPVYRVSKKKLMLFQIQISCEFITVYSYGYTENRS